LSAFTIPCRRTSVSLGSSSYHIDSGPASGILALMRKPSGAIPLNAIVAASAILLIASPLLIKIILPSVHPSASLFLTLTVAFVHLLLAAIPFLIGILVWRFKKWNQGKHETPLAPLPPNPLP
jgi:hypothetical protein